MIHSNLRQTVFNIEKLRNVVNVGSFSAFQIHATPGKHLGQMGAIVNPALKAAANEEEFHVTPAASAVQGARIYWLRTALGSMRS